MKIERSLIENLKSDLMQIRKKIEAGDDNLPIELGLLKVLFDIENELDNDTPNKDGLEKGAFGIFRLVTESYVFQKSSLGQELLSLRVKIKKFASTLEKSE